MAPTLTVVRFGSQGYLPPRLQLIVIYEEFHRDATLRFRTRRPTFFQLRVTDAVYDRVTAAAVGLQRPDHLVTLDVDGAKFGPVFDGS